MRKLPFDQKGAIGMESLKWTAFRALVLKVPMFILAFFLV